MAVQPFTLRRLLYRLSAALISVATGWGVGIIVYALYTSHPGRANWHDVEFWGLYTGGFCLAGWFFVGLPLSCLNIDFTSVRRVVFSVLAVGGIGVLMIALFSAPVFFRFWQIYALAFITASAAMLVYIALVRRAA